MPGVVNATKFEVEDQSGILGESDEGNNLKYVRLSLCRNQTPLDYVKYLISMFEDNISDYALVIEAFALIKPSDLIYTALLSSSEFIVFATVSATVPS